MKQNNILIVTGGTVSKETLNHVIGTCSFNTVIAVDKGLEILSDQHIPVNLLMGDFDSVSLERLQSFRQNNPDTKIMPYQPEKDATDTELAISQAMDMNPDQVYLLGTIGTRMDHTLANISLLERFLEVGITCYMIDDKNRICMRNQSFTLKKEEQYGTYVSLLAFLRPVTGLTLTGMKYPLQHARLEPVSSLGVSNEIIGTEANISWNSGVLLVIESRD